MGIILIIIGAAVLVVGIMMVASKSRDSQSNEMSTPIITNNEESLPIQSSEAGTDQYIKPDKIEDSVAKEGSAVNSQETDSSKAKGNSFEDFVVNLLADWRLTLLDRTQDAVSSAGVVAESSKNPDLHISQKRGNGTIDYYIECKYRSKWQNGEVQFEKWQIDRYHKFQRQEKRKVIIALGVGGTPSSPQTFMLVPLDSLKNNAIRKIDTQYVVQPNSSALIEYMNSYFTTVFDKAKTGGKH